MAIMKKIKPKEIFMGRLDYGCDLRNEITEICKGIRIGRIEALGAVQSARLSFYNQKWHDYQTFEIDRPLEITKLIGNVFIKEGEPFVHAHITLADETGKTWGVHLEKGPKVFACEIILETYDGPDFVRIKDDEIGLFLWKMSNKCVYIRSQGNGVD